MYSSSPMSEARSRSLGSRPAEVNHWLESASSKELRGLALPSPSALCRYQGTQRACQGHAPLKLEMPP